MKKTSKSDRKSVSSDAVTLSKSFLNLYIGNYEADTAMPTSNILYQERFYGESFSPNDASRPFKAAIATPRQLNSWEQYGILGIKRKGNEWRKLSLMDAIWINIIYELRTFGYTIEQIKKVRKSLENDSKKYNVPMPLLEFCVIEAIARKRPIYLLAFQDGSAVPVPYPDYLLNLHRGIDHHILLDLNRIIQRILPATDLKPVYDLKK